MAITIGTIKETTPHENRVAITPETCKKFSGLGLKVMVESGAGEASNFTDSEYTEAGATVGSTKDVLSSCDLLVTVQPNTEKDTIEGLKKAAVIIGMFNPLGSPETATKLAEAGITSISLELVPRITRAQSMDVLSSQSNLAGYKAVLDGIRHSQKVVPMMMTAAGTIKPAKVLVLGAGVAGLQAIATAKRLGAIVSAFDVRPVVKEQVESLGAKFIEVESEETENAETSGGYAKEMSEDYKKKQAQLIHDTLKEQDIVITTALIPGKPAPELITAAMIKDMKQGSVVVDLAAANGGNAAHTKADEVIEKDGVTFVGHTNVPSRVAADASALYARNIANLVDLLFDKESQAITLDEDDEIIKGCLMTKGGKVVNAMLNDMLGSKAKTPTETKKAKPKTPPASVTRDSAHKKNKAKAAKKKAGE